MIVVVPVDPPSGELALSGLVDETPLRAGDASRLYEASLRDVTRSVAASGGDLLVNYRDRETLPETVAKADPEATIRELVVDAIGESADVRFERQVGSTRSARMGNTVTHLLEREGATSVAVLEPTAPLVRRTELDGAAMSLRTHDVVLGPSADGAVYLACFTDPIDFTDVYQRPALPRLARRSADEFAVGFAPTVPTIAERTGLAGTIAAIEARSVAGASIPEATATVVDELGLSIDETGSIVRS